MDTATHFKSSPAAAFPAPALVTADPVANALLVPDDTLVRPERGAHLGGRPTSVLTPSP